MHSGQRGLNAVVACESTGSRNSRILRGERRGNSRFRIPNGEITDDTVFVVRSIESICKGRPFAARQCQDYVPAAAHPHTERLVRDCIIKVFAKLIQFHIEIVQSKSPTVTEITVIWII